MNWLSASERWRGEMSSTAHGRTQTGAVIIPAGVMLAGDLTIASGARGLVVFAHGSGSSRFSPRNQQVAAHLHDGGFGTLLFDLLTAEEESIDARTGEFRFDIPLLADRLTSVTDWLDTQALTRELPIGYFGASTGAAAALIAAASRPEVVRAIVSRGGRPDLAGAALGRVGAPTLLIVGGNDEPVIEMNRAALARLASRRKKLEIVPGATHLFEEPGTLDRVCELALEWFTKHLAEPASTSR
jgi:pimeloyl-ACP methyl ester carboxylesterase